MVTGVGRFKVMLKRDSSMISLTEDFDVWRLSRERPCSVPGAYGGSASVRGICSSWLSGLVRRVEYN